MNILSLDPMYSPLHNLISRALPKGKRLSLLSSFGLCIYMSDYDCRYINSFSKGGLISDKYLDLVQNDINHYTMSMKKNKQDIEYLDYVYMANFAFNFERFLISEKVDFVLLHNDLRWQHSLAVKICKSLNVKYLVTEQGLFRPNTTVVDKKGVNAFSSIQNLSFDQELKYDFNLSDSNDVGHNSLISMCYFFCYLILTKVGMLLGKESRIVHNRHRLIDYLKRYFMLKSKAKKRTSDEIEVSKYIFIPLQLENDTQILVHSEFSSNQEIIDGIESAFHGSTLELDGYKLVFKLHPNDTSNYNFSSKSILTERSISTLLDKALLAITVNSSASLEIISTSVPLICLGDSMYNHNGVASKLAMDELKKVFNKLNWPEVDINTRKTFISFLKKHYSILGAGFSFSENEINRIKQYIESDGVFLE